MFRDMTCSDASRLEAIDGSRVAFVMDEDAFRAFYDRTARGLGVSGARYGRPSDG